MKLADKMDMNKSLKTFKNCPDQIMNLRVMCHLLLNWPFIHLVITITSLAVISS